MADAASSAVNTFSDLTSSILSGPPMSVWTFTSASYMLCPKARLVVLGMMRATRKGLAGASVAGTAVAGTAVAAGACVGAGASVGVAGVAHAVNTIVRDTVRATITASFFMQFSLSRYLGRTVRESGYSCSYMTWDGTSWQVD